MNALPIGRAALTAALIAGSSAPASAGAQARLLDETLAAPAVAMLSLAAEDPAPPKDAVEPGLDFDLLGEGTAPVSTAEDRRMARRRRMLGIHQTAGIGLVGLQLATTVVGQLNYNDKFGDANTGKYVLSHQALAYSTLAVFLANGGLALFAPSPPAKVSRGFDRTTIHKIAMFTAAAGMAAQAGLGLYTRSREGYENKQDIGRAHLVVGYVTLAAVSAGVSALVF